MKTILIPEISETGHHPGYVRHILESVNREGSNVLVAGTRNLVLHSELDPVRDRFTPIEIEVSKSEEARLNDFSTIGLVRREFCVRSIYARVWRDATRGRQVDMVIIPFVDDCSNALALLGTPFGRTPWVGISMRTQFHLPEVGVIADRRMGAGVRAALFRRLLKQANLRELLTIDPTLIHYARHKEGREFAKLHYLPDPSDNLPLLSKREARSSLGIPEDCKAILVYGSLSERKGIAHLIGALSLPECPEIVHVIVAGSQDAGVKALLESPAASMLIASNRLHLVSGYIPTSRVAQLVYASDAMWIGYIDFYTMSSVLVLASRHGLPSITTEQGIVGYLSRMHGCGLPVDPRSEKSIVEVLRRIATDDPSLARAAENARSAFSAHSHAEFYRIVGDSVRMAGGHLNGLTHRA
jgi:glycosyltransferase involved in cell wall biosynthesis